MTIVSPIVQPVVSPIVGPIITSVELVVNGGFDTDSDWVKGAGWTITAGVGRATAATGNLQQTIADRFITDASYLVKFTLSNYVDGTYRILLYSGTKFGQTTNKTANGIYSEIVTLDTVAVAANGLLNILTSVNGTVDVDNVSVIKV